MKIEFKAKEMENIIVEIYNDEKINELKNKILELLDSYLSVDENYIPSKKELEESKITSEMYMSKIFKPITRDISDYPLVIIFHK